MGVVSAAVRTHREFIVRLVKPKRFSVGLDGFVEDIYFCLCFQRRLACPWYLFRISKWKFYIVSRWSNGFDSFEILTVCFLRVTVDEFVVPFKRVVLRREGSLAL
jgi:hypothetical protein